MTVFATPAVVVRMPESVPSAISWPFCTANDVRLKTPLVRVPPATVPVTGRASDGAGEAARAEAGAPASATSPSAATIAVVRCLNRVIMCILYLFCLTRCCVRTHRS
jgi:hypothetical protein